MHCICVLVFLVAALISYGQCLLMIVQVSLPEFVYAPAVLKTVNGNHWIFQVKSAHKVHPGSPKIENVTNLKYHMINKNCGITFSKSTVAEAEKSVPVCGEHEILIQGKIVDVTYETTESCYYMSIEIFNKISITQTQEATTEAFNGFNISSSGNYPNVIVLQIPDTKMDNLAKLFENSISTIVQLDDQKKKEILIQPLGIPHMTIMDNNLLFFRIHDYIQPEKGYSKEKDDEDCLVGGRNGHELFVRSKSYIKLFSDVDQVAMGMINANRTKTEGIIWIQQVWNDQNKKFEEITDFNSGNLMNLKWCSLSTLITHRGVTRSIEDIEENDWTYVNIQAINFDPFQKKFLVLFNFGEPKAVQFMFGSLHPFDNARAKIFTITGGNDVKSFYLDDNSKSVIKEPRNVFEYGCKKDCKPISMTFQNRGTNDYDNVLKRQFVQYRYE